MRFGSVSELTQRRAEMMAANARVRRRVIICAGTGCVANGALAVQAEFERLGRARELPLTVTLEACGDHGAEGEAPTLLLPSGCHGFCQLGPLVHMMPDDILYTHVKVRDVADIVESTFFHGTVVERLLYKDPTSGRPCRGRNDIPFYHRQTRVALASCGVIDPESLDDYLAHGGYRALVLALTTMQPTDVVAAVEQSGLRGRGGGGYPTGRKWRSCLKAEGTTRYVICNGDEGDPGAFMDRSIMEGDPFKVIEGMTLGAYALGAQLGYIYVRHEYPLAVKRMVRAIEAAHAAGLLGAHILGSDLSFDIRVNRGGGAFVCGESSALMRSLEGKVGEPRPKYVHATDKGLHDQPTVLNNVETWVCVPPIVEHGADWFAALGTTRSKGTKAFSLVGKVNNTGLVEVPMGITLREIIFDIGGGIRDGKQFKAVQTGGPSGGCLPSELLDLPVDFDSLTQVGAMMGSGGMIVMDDRTCMVDVARYFIDFLIQESCGKCVPCREGLVQMAHLLGQVTRGTADPTSLERIEQLGAGMKVACLCALGRSAPNPVLSTLRYFRDEYEAHIRDRRCPGRVCKPLITYSINDRCTGCTLCANQCPVHVIAGQKKQQHTIDATGCIRCGACEAVCAFAAVDVR